MRTFSIQTLGCKVNQYESEQISALLRARGLVQVDRPDAADLCVINTCSVTTQAASKSRQTVRRGTRLPVLQQSASALPLPALPLQWQGSVSDESSTRTRVIVTGCWATSDPEQARQLPGVDAVLGHHDDVAAELNRLLDGWFCSMDPSVRPPGEPPTYATNHTDTAESPEPPEPLGDDVSIIQAGVPTQQLYPNSKPQPHRPVKEKPHYVGTHALPLLGERSSTVRAFLKVQDGCDAHCTYCIIPRLRPTLWSKSIDDAVEEARRLVDAGHLEIVLTGIFLGAYGQQTALRHRQDSPGSQAPIARLVHALCTRVPGLRRLRFSSLEPGDLNPKLIDVLRDHEQVVPHFHLPLQSGCDELLRRMNRQYTRDEYLRMIEQVHAGFARPAITTDIIVGFPGETDARFEQTLDVVQRARFIHIHGFSFSPRPGTAAARWKDEFVHGPIVNQRIERLQALSADYSTSFRRQFVGQTVELLVERQARPGSLRHGRCERYFDVWFEDADVRAGDAVRVRIDRVTSQRTWGTIISR